MSTRSEEVSLLLLESGLGWELGKDSDKTCGRDGVVIAQLCLRQPLLSLPESGLGWEWVRGVRRSHSPYSPPSLRPPKKAVTSFILDLVPAGLFGRTGGHSALQRPDHWQLVSNGRPVH